MKFSTTLVFFLSAALLVLAGCFGGDKAQPEKAADDSPKSSSGIIGKTTQDIGEYDPEKGETVSDGSMKTPSPLNPLGAMNAYGPAVEKISKLQIKQAINFFYAEHGRYPKDHEEFMSKIITANNIQLPVLPGGAKYQYDVENHELVVIKPQDK